MTRTNTTPPYAAFGEMLARMRARLRALEQRPGGALPLVDADPSDSSRIRAWIMTDGRLRWRDHAGAVHQAAEATPGADTSTPTLPGLDQSVHTVRETFTAQWVASYPGAAEAGAYGDGLTCMIGFGAAPGDALASAVSITAVEVWLYQAATQAAAVPLGIGTHTAAAAPAVYEGTAPLSRVDLPAIGSPGWVRIARDIGWRMRDEGARGLVIDQSATGQVAGRIAAAPPRMPQIRLTYRQ